MNGHFQDTKAAEELKPYLQAFCEGCYAGISNIVFHEVQDLEGVIFLQELIENTWLAGALNWLKTHPKYEQAVAVD